eukprot:29577-Pelagococcus_subviridis.AAC.1
MRSCLYLRRPIPRLARRARAHPFVHPSVRLHHDGRRHHRERHPGRRPPSTHEREGAQGERAADMHRVHGEEGGHRHQGHGRADAAQHVRVRRRLHELQHAEGGVRSDARAGRRGRVERIRVDGVRVRTDGDGEDAHDGGGHREPHGEGRHTARGVRRLQEARERRVVRGPLGDVLVSRDLQRRARRSLRCVLLTLVPIRPRWRGERRSLRTFSPGVSLRPPLAFNPRLRRLSTPTDAFELHPDSAASRGRRRRRRRRRGDRDRRRVDRRGVASEAIAAEARGGPDEEERPLRHEPHRGGRDAAGGRPGHHEARE